MRILAVLLVASLVSGCPHTGKLLTYGADGLPPPNPDPRDLIPKNTEPTPDLSEGRTVSEQDCSKPVDPSLGNLRCK